MISTGHGEPAMMPVRSDDTSNRASSGSASIGDEHRRHAVQRRAPLGGDGLEHARGSNASDGITMQRAVRDGARLPITMPKQW